MSHVAAIINYKKELLSNGVTDPELQIEFVRTAYISALIRLLTKYDVNKEDRKEYLQKVLSYWNEVYPVDGNIIILEIENFYRRLRTSLLGVKSDLFVKLVTNDSFTKFPEFNDLETYNSLVNIIYSEAESKYNSFGRE